MLRYSAASSAEPAASQSSSALANALAHSARDFAVAGKLTGDEDVGDSVQDERFGFRERRTRRADRPRVDLAARQSRGLVAFVMRTQPGRASAEKAPS